jgi:hypothetical protein
MTCDKAYEIMGNENENDPQFNEAVYTSIGCLRKRIKELNDEIDKSASKQKSYSSGLSEGYKGIRKTVMDLLKSQKEFTFSLERQYALGERMAQKYKEVSLNMGLSVGRTDEFAKMFNKASAEIAEFGGDLEDAAGIYKGFTEDSGRARIISPEDVENIYLLQKTTGMMGNQSAKLYETFDLMGKSLSDVNEEMETLMKDSQSIGLNSSKVIKTLADNIKNMQTFSFVNGVKGMTEMAKQAVKMRVDVSSVLQMADKFYQPEAAIEAAAQLQLLGGDIADAFGDPFTIMYEARNKPEELAKRVQKMTENMIQFNKESGEYELPAEARMQLKAVGDQLGFNIDSMVEMTRQGAKMKDVKMQLSGSMFSEEEIEGIANMAKVKGGEFKVDIFDPTTKERIETNIKDLNRSQVKMLLQSPKDEKEYMQQMALNSMTTNEQLQALNDQFEKSFVAAVNYYKTQESLAKPTIVTFKEGSAKLLEQGIKEFNLDVIKEMGGITTESIIRLNEELNKGILNKIESLTVENVKKQYEEIKKLFEGSEDKPIDDTGEDATGKSLIESKDFLSRSDGTKVSFSSMDNVIGTLSDGTGPVADTFKLLSSVISNNNNNSGVMEVKGNAKIDVNINSDNPNIDFTPEQKNQLITMITERIGKSLYNEDITGGNTTDGFKSRFVYNS